MQKEFFGDMHNWRLCVYLHSTSIGPLIQETVQQALDAKAAC